MSRWMKTARKFDPDEFIPPPDQWMKRSLGQFGEYVVNPLKVGEYVKFVDDLFGRTYSFLTPKHLLTLSGHVFKVMKFLHDDTSSISQNPLVDLDCVSLQGLMVEGPVYLHHLERITYNKVSNVPAPDHST